LPQHGNLPLQIGVSDVDATAAARAKEDDKSRKADSQYKFVGKHLSPRDFY
jgi:hypothetical protein